MRPRFMRQRKRAGDHRSLQDGAAAVVSASRFLEEEGHTILGTRAVAHGVQAFVIEITTCRSRSHRSRFSLKVFGDSPQNPRLNSDSEIRREFETLRTYSLSLQGLGSGGNQITCPRPVALFLKQRSYLMTTVPGKPITRLAALGYECPRTVSDRIAVGLNQFHNALGEAYGDFSPSNVLVEPSAEVVSFIDPHYAHRPPNVECALSEPLVSTDLGYWLALSASQQLRAATQPATAYRLAASTAQVAASVALLTAGPEAHRILHEAQSVAHAYIDQFPRRSRLAHATFATLKRKLVRRLMAAAATKTGTRS